MRKGRRLDWEVQAGTAYTAFERNGFVTLVGERQVDDLSEVHWSGADLVWSLHLAADECGLDDGSAQCLPAIIAAALNPDQLDGLAPAQQVFMNEVTEHH